MSNFNLRARFVLVPACCLAAWLAAAAEGPTPLLTRKPDQLLAVLKSDAEYKAKADACRELAVVGTKDAVPTLLGLLADEKLHHMARYALETMADPAIDPALREALGRFKGRPLTGVMGTLGVRHDAQAVKPIAAFLADPDNDTAQAAARALGRIGTAEAAKALDDAVGKASPANQVAFCEGVFRCAEALSAKGDRAQALKLYERLRGLPVPQQVRAGALRGAILLRPADGVKLLRESLRSSDFVLVDAAARTSQELPGVLVTAALAEELSQLRPDNRIVVIQALGKRADAAALPALVKAGGKDAEPAVRQAVVRAVAEIGGAGAVAALSGWLDDAEPAFAQAALEGLAAQKGKEADAAVTVLLASSNRKQQLRGIDLAGRRRMNASLPVLLKAAAGTDAEVRQAAIKRLGELATEAELPALLGLLGQASAAGDLDALEQAIGAVCAQAKDPAACAPTVIAQLGSAQPAQKVALLGVLAGLGGGPALQAVRAAAGDANAEVHTAALRALGSWKSAEAAAELLALAQAASSPTDRLLCLRGYFGWASQPDVPADQRLAMCQRAAGLAKQAEEKKLLLGALGSVKSLPALAQVAPLLEEADVKNEACAATLAFADELIKGAQAAAAAPRLIEPLQKAAQAASNPDLAQRARAQLKRAQDKAGVNQ
jgi:HEAT repeat protein